MPVRTQSDRRYEVAVHRDVRIPARDRDVTLSGDLFLPANAGPVPVLITALPYRRDVAALNGSATERWFAARGYASLLVDLRGTGSSDGTQRPPFDPDDAVDALAAIDWAVKQPWCDGAVGMWGHSYGAMTAMRTASHRPPALRAIIAVEGFTDPARDFVHPGGARGAFSPLGSWALGNLFNQLLPPLDDYADPAEQARWHRRLTAAPYLLDLYRHGPGAPVWAEREIDLPAIDVPALCVAGWRDLFSDGTLRAYERVSGPKRLVAGPWMHVMPQDCPFTPIDFLSLAKSWWDRWLCGVENYAEMPPVSVHVQGARPRWLEFPQWPPGGGTRTDDLVTWQRSEPPALDPAVGLQSGLWSTPAGLFGAPLDQHDDDVRSLCYTSPPFAEPLLVSGRPVVRVANPWPRVSVKLTVVDQAGRSTLVCAGLESTVDDMVDVGLTPTTYEVPAGHRLRVVIAPGDFPRVWPAFPSGAGWPVALTLTLPVVSPQDGSEIDYPPPDDATEPVAEYEPEPADQAVWETTTDLLNDRVSLLLAGSNTVEPTDAHVRKHVLRAEQVLAATADRVEPDASNVTGTITGTIDTETGAHITVDVSLTATSSAIEATGRITRDGETILDRRWRG
jgi:predicted acyl esterase